MPADAPLIAVDPLYRTAALYQYEGLLKLLPAGGGGGGGASAAAEDVGRAYFGDTYNVRLAEAHVLDIAFLHPSEAALLGGSQGPVLGVLFRDAGGAVNVRTYEVRPGGVLTDGPLPAKSMSNRPPPGGPHPTGERLLPVPQPLGGVLVLSSERIVYYNGKDRELDVIDVPRGFSPKCWAPVPNAGATFLIGDAAGGVFLLAATPPSGTQRGVEISLTRVDGETSIASAIAFLDNGYVCVGSAGGDSQLVKVDFGRVAGGAGASASAAPPSLAQVQSFSNLGPIVDFTVMGDRLGASTIVTASGVGRDGSLRIVRSGMTIEEQAVVELPGIRGLWSLRGEADPAHDALLVQSFANETRVFGIAGEEMAEAEVADGFNLGAPTLHTANLRGAVVQVTPAEVRLLGADGTKLLRAWKPADVPAMARARITHASTHGSTLLLGLSGGRLALLGVDASLQFSILGSRTLPNDVACLALGVAGDVEASPRAGGAMDLEDGAAAPTLAAVSTWSDVSVRLLTLPSLADAVVEPLGGDITARSLSLVRFEGVLYALVALGDGHLLNFRVGGVGSSTPTLSDRRKVALGTQPISLSYLRIRGVLAVFASCDRPFVVHSSGGKLQYSPVCSGPLTAMAPFHSAAFPDCLALASETGLTIGTVDELQKLHIRTIPLLCQPRRVLHHAASHTLLAAVEVRDAGSPFERGVLRAFNDTTFESEAQFELDPAELCFSLSIAPLGGVPYIIVGTAVSSVKDEEEATRGRILVLTVVGGEGARRRLVLVAEREVAGAAYCSVGCAGGLLAVGLNSKVQVYKWRAGGGAGDDAPADDAPTGALIPECAFVFAMAALQLDARGDLLLVGDLMRSVTMLRYSPVSSALVEVAADPDGKFMMASALLDDVSALGAEQSYNLFTASLVAKPSALPGKEDEVRLAMTGEFHLGDAVNRFKAGALVMMPAETTGAAAGGEGEGNDEGTAAKRFRADVAVAPAAPSPAGARPRFIFGTVGGMMGAVISLPEGLYQYLKRVEVALATAAVLPLSFPAQAAWRSYFRSDRPLTQKLSSSGAEVHRSTGFVDGDFLETLVDLPRESLDRVVAALNDPDAPRRAAMHPDGSGAASGPATADELMHAVEELPRMH